MEQCCEGWQKGSRGREASEPCLSEAREEAIVDMKSAETAESRQMGQLGRRGTDRAKRDFLQGLRDGAHREELQRLNLPSTEGQPFE